MDDEFVLTILKTIDLFSELDNPPLIELGRLFKEKIYNQKETIFKEDSIGNSMMIIASGEVRVSQTPGDNTEETLVVLKKGDVFGEMSLLEGLPRSATTIAHTNVIVLEITRSDFLDYLEKDSESGVKILLKLCRTLSSRLRETDVKLKTFISLSQWI